MIRKLLGAGMAFVLLLGLAGCRKSVAKEVGVEDAEDVEIEIPTEQELETDYTDVKSIAIIPGARLAVVAKGMDTAYWQAVKSGAEKAIDDINEAFSLEGEDKVVMTFEGPADDADEEKQINTIDAVLSEYPDVMCIAAVDQESCQAQLEAAQDNGIPVLMLDSGVESDLVVGNCMTDNSAATHCAVEKIHDAIGGSGKVLIAAHAENSETSQIRVKGFLAVVKNVYTDIEVTNILYKTEENNLAQEMKDAIAEDPDVKAIFCTNEEVAEIALDVLEDLDREDLILVGFDAGQKQIDAVAEGREYGMVCQNPYGMGYAAVVAAFRAAANQKVDTFIDSGFQWIDQDNIMDEENQKYLYI